MIQNQNILVFGAVIVWSLGNTWWRKRLLGFVHNRLKHNYKISSAEFQRIEYIFNQRIPYFSALSDDARARFINRAIDFAELKSFVGVDGFELTREVKVMIGAAAAQITWGLKLTELSHIQRVLVYPKEFYHGVSRRYLKGGVSKGGTLLLSWDDFCKGYENHTDNRNLGLHEMAHALKLEKLHGLHKNTFYRSYLKSWLDISRPTFKALRNGEAGYLRAYGGTNDHEFFAVCVEHFFETPAEFYREHRRVYEHLCVVLNQDPLNADGDYKLDKKLRGSLIRETGRLWHQPLNTGYKDFNRFHRQIGYAMFVFFLSVFTGFSPKYMLTSEITIHGALLTVCALGIQLPYIVRHRYLDPRFLIAFVLMTFGLMHTTSIALLLLFR